MYHESYLKKIWSPYKYDEMKEVSPAHTQDNDKNQKQKKTKKWRKTKR